MDKFLDNLNQQQKSAVIHDSGPLLIVAGAGTGKTTVLINRLLYLIKNKQIKPENLLLVTFTEKASQELTERADKLLPYGYTDLWISTFHGLAERILRDYGLDIGLPTDYKVLSQTEQWIFIKKHLAELKLDYYKPLGNPNKFINELVRHFSRLKDENILPAEYLDFAQELRQNQDNVLSGAKQRLQATADSFDAKGKLDADKIYELANAYHTYNQLMLDNKFLDFGDLIIYTLKLFTDRPQILNYYQAKFSYVMVDEFQDTNYSQYQLIKMLAAPKNNLLAVGDDDQSIFKFRGASLSNIMQFKDDYPEAKEIVLNNNYRSGQKILDSAYEFISHNNPDRLEVKLGLNKKLKAQNDGGVVKSLMFANTLVEAKAVVQMIKALHESAQADWSDMAILIRANATADRFINELKGQNLPHQFVSLRGLYYKPIILDILAYLRLLDNYHESGALLRVLNLEPFKVDHLDLVNLLRFARTKLYSFFEALNNARALPKLSASAQVSIDRLLSAIKQHTEVAKTKSVASLYVKIVHDIFLPSLADSHKEDFDYLNQFYKKINEFEVNNPGALLPDFLELIDWELEAGETGGLKLNFDDVDTIKVMTVHTAKGLEFKYVWLVDVVDKRFPVSNRSEAIPVPEQIVKEILPGGDAHLAEERRLFYVAMTRAKESLYITGALDHGGATSKKPSKFIAEAGITPEVIGQEESLSELTQALDGLDKKTVEPIINWQLPKRFSYSQLETFDRCPWLYKHTHLLKIPLPPRAATVFGRTMHNVLREWLSVLLTEAQADLFGQLQPKTAKDLSWSRLKKIYEQSWQDYGYDNRDQAEEYKQLGLRALKDFQAEIEPNQLPEILFLEKKFFPKVGGYQLDCTIDRVDKLADGSLEIIDYKTGEAKLKPSFDDKRQLLLYQLAIEQLTNFKVSRLSYYYLKTSDKVSFEAKEADLEKLKIWISDTIKAIESCDFSPKPGPFTCRYCDISKFCEFADL